MVSKNAAALLDDAIGQLIFENGLAFRLSDSNALQQIIKLSKHVPASYKPPGRMKVSGPLLDAAFNRLMEHGRRQFDSQEAMIFGLSLIGDGATIKKMPLFNIIVSMTTEPCFVVKVCDARPYLRKGIGKTGLTIYDECLPVMKQIDPTKQKFDCVIFYGGSNMVSASRSQASLIRK